MGGVSFGRILSGSQRDLERSRGLWEAQPVDLEMLTGAEGYHAERETTIAAPVSVSGRGTFLGRAQRTLNLHPCDTGGWRFDRTDLPECMPIPVAVGSVWTTKGSNIVLCSGSPHNYMRMIEHMVALRIGMGLDDLTIRMASGDPPLFDRGSLDLVQAVERAGIVPTGRPTRYVTVAEPVCVTGRNGSFLAFLPCEGRTPSLEIDCAVDFKSAIGRQRVRFFVNRETFRHGAVARTNTTLAHVIYCLTVGKLFADIRNLGYTTSNILIAGRRRYLNRPQLVLPNGKSLEAAWHRATLDLLAAVALIDVGRFAGRIVSYKAGHTLDVEMVRQLYRGRLLKPLA